ncbi:MAG: ATP-binding protein [Candidatus Parabeggiatoa sp. nov. 1]|nr:MAG: ATP-binding protein [Gammaproteobacteria bacterium]
MMEKTALEELPKENLLPKNPVLASLTIVAWLMFKPSAWRRYIANIDADLSPDFALAHLNSHHWQQVALRKLLYLGHGLCAIWVSGIVVLCLWLLDAPGEILIFVSCYALLFSIVGGILGSLTVSLAYGIMAGIVGGILLSLPIGMVDISEFTLDEWDNMLVFSMAKNIAIAVMLSVLDLQITLQNTDPRALWIVLLGIFTASQAGRAMYSTTITPYSHPQYRQIGSIMIGGLISAVGVFLVIGLMSVLARSAAWMQTGTLYVLAYDGLIVGVFSLSIALIWFFLTWRWRQSLLLGVGAGLFLGLFTLLKNVLYTSIYLKPWLIGLHGGIENAMLYMLLFAFPYVLAKRIANPWAGVIAGILGSAGVYIIFALITGRDSLLLILLSLAVLLLGMTTLWWRPLLFYPFQAAWNLLLHHADEKRIESQTSLLHWHSAFWDEHQYIRLFGLESYLVMVAERNPVEGKAAIEHLSSTAQKWAAKEAQIELDARRLQSCTHVIAISNAHRHLAAGELKGPVSSLLRTFSRVSRDVKAALAQESHYNQRLALDAVEERLEGLLRELTRSSEPYALRFRPIAETWRQTIADYVRTLSEAVESRQEIINPYIIGIPLTEHQEIFVGRSDVSERIERLLLDSRCPPLLLYGQRRTGKTSLLNNLGKLLPWRIIPLFVDLQGPASLAKDYAGFLYNISRAILASAKRHREMALPPLTREHLSIDPFTSFDEWLDEIEQHLDMNQTMLLILDEFSALEHIFNKGLLDEESVLGMFRHIIQHRSRIKILLSGSHTLDEFERWASYLINVQTVHIGYLQAPEALQLIEQPVKDFALRYEDAASRRVLELTRCHPALIQLICAEIVTLKNKQHVNERRLAEVRDVEAAIPGALQHGRFFFADIANNQVTKKGSAMLRFLAVHGEGQILCKDTLREHCFDEFEATITNLLQRELIEALGNGYCFQVELMRRWFV